MRLDPVRPARVLVLCVASLGIGLAGATPASAQTPASSRILYRLPGHASGDEYGAAVCSTDDLNGDHVPDFAVASPFGAGGRGFVEVFSGAKGFPLYTLQGGTPGDWFGYSVCGLPDLDGDGLAELCVGAPLADGLATGAGLVEVYSGATGTLLYSKHGDSAQDHMGFAVASAGDLDLDGVGDFLASAIDDDNFGGSSGSVRAYSGATGLGMYTLSGYSFNQLFGYALASVGDWNGDGAADFAVGAPYIPDSPEAGYARVFSGLDHAVLFTIDGGNARDEFGKALARVSDIDHDGRDELLIGAPQVASHGNGYAELHVSSSPGTARFQVRGDSHLDWFGAAVCGTGDVDGDGVNDFAVGAPRDDDLGPQCGSVRVFSGQTGLALSTVYGPAGGLELGAALCSAADFNADQLGDLVVGCPGDSTLVFDQGSARVLSTGDLAMSSDRHLVSIANVQPQPLVIDLGVGNAGRTYIVLGSITGTTPGTYFGTLPVPLVRDRYFAFTVTHPGNGAIAGGLGQLDGNGQALASFVVPSGALSPAYLGLTFYHSVILLDQQGTAVLAGNTVPLTLVP